MMAHGHWEIDRLYEAVRGLVAIVEVGVFNSAQDRLLHGVKVALGDATGRGCLHEFTHHDAADRCLCDACGEDLTPVPETVASEGTN